jgi:dihydroxyacetone kinase-like protein
MSTLVGKPEFIAMLIGAIAKVRDGSDYLSQLDSAGGDGDHGITMRRAMGEIEKTLAANQEASLRDLLSQVGWTLLGIDGGATGPLLGSFFMGVAEEVGERQRLDVAGLAGAFEAGVAQVRKQSKAQIGDKTMIDALLPAVEALRGGVNAGKDVEQSLLEAAEAAGRGADATKNFVAKFGKARFSGERTLGHPDPGATSMAMIFAGFCEGMKLFNQAASPAKL